MPWLTEPKTSPHLAVYVTVWGVVLEAGDLKSDVVGVDEVVLGANNTRLRIAKFAVLSVQDLNIETANEVVAHVRLTAVRMRLIQHTPPTSLAYLYLTPR